MFEPSWQAVIGSVTEAGKGLLSPNFKAQSKLIESFKLFLGTHTVTIRPKDGQILFDNTVVLKLRDGGQLIWARTMQKDIQAGGDKNSSGFQCVYYKAGLEDTAWQKHGWRVYEDGRMLKGIS